MTMPRGPLLLGAAEHPPDPVSPLHFCFGPQNFTPYPVRPGCMTMLDKKRKVSAKDPATIWAFQGVPQSEGAPQFW